MARTKNRVRTIGDIAAYYWRRPNRLGEVRLWAKHRGHTTMELEYPWWNYRAVQAVMDSLPPNARVFEYGGGGSTLWLMNLGAQCTTVEHDNAWYALLRAAVPPSCVVLKAPPKPTGSVRSTAEPEGFFDGYVHAIKGQPDSSLDLVVVDGRARVDCGIVAMHKIKPGGMLLLDDSDRKRYLPLRTALAGWDLRSYRGVKLGGGGLSETSIWTKPA